MTSPRTVIVAGAGIGGLTAALALARAGHRVVVLEAARELSDVGAGLQLSPNATRVLASLGLTEALRPHAIAPLAVRIMNARAGREIARIPLGADAERRYGAPYWVAHRGDLQRILKDAVAATPEIILRLGFNVLDHAAGPNGVAVAGKTWSGVIIEEKGDALIGADGLWSNVRARLGHEAAPQFRGRTAWRALIEATAADPAWREPYTTLWLGPGAHIVHYPVRGGSAINVVAITQADSPAQRGWAGPGDRDRLLAGFAGWHPHARAVLAAAAQWQTWSLHDLSPRLRPGRGAVALAGDAAHAMLPFLAQGAAMAIEDAAVLARSVAERPNDMSDAFRAYEAARGERTIRVQREATVTGQRYGWRGPLAALRNAALRRMGSERLLARYDWLYGWSPP